mgnify:CR=1 FL=1
MKRSELHSVMIGIFGFALLFGFQNCAQPQNNGTEKTTQSNSEVIAFSKRRCVVQEVSDYNEPSIPKFDESVYEKYDVYYNDADCDGNIDAMLVDFDDSEVVITCFNYQSYGFGNCYPQTTSAFVCSEVGSDCGVDLKTNDIPVLDDVYIQQTNINEGAPPQTGNTPSVNQ